MFYYDSISPQSLTKIQLDQFLALGWYRMHQSLFTTSHVELGALYRVHWLRFEIPQLQEHASHRRICNRGRHFKFVIEDVQRIRPDHIELHKRYRSSIDFDGADSIEQCLYGEGDAQVTIFQTKSISVFDQHQLIAGSYFDVGNEAAASILNFFDPAYARYSLGKYLILITLNYLRQTNYKFYYPGYVVQGLSKMDYKLFLGKEQARYYDPLTASWKKFHDSILIANSNLEKPDHQ